jgi:serine/threonine protein kinase
MIDTNFNIKLADFGLAKNFNHSISAMKSFVGTLAYSWYYNFIN